MGNWIPNDPTLVAQILKISSAYSPLPPEGFVSPMTWGVESKVVDRFSGAGIPKEYISFVKDTEAAEKNGRVDDLHAELEELFTKQNQSSTQGHHVDSRHLLTRDHQQELTCSSTQVGGRIKQAKQS
jgi:hypothetical protein